MNCGIILFMLQSILPKMRGVYYIGHNSALGDDVTLSYAKA